MLESIVDKNIQSLDCVRAFYECIVPGKTELVPFRSYLYSLEMDDAMDFWMNSISPEQIQILQQNAQTVITLGGIALGGLVVGVATIALISSAISEWEKVSGNTVEQVIFDKVSDAAKCFAHSELINACYNYSLDQLESISG
jgi:hypothetical protein